MERQFELFEIISRSEKLKEFRETYIKTLKEPVLKVLSSSSKWFSFDRGLFDPSKEMGSSFFEMAFIPTNHYNPSFIQNFIEFGTNEIDSLKAVKYEGKNTFMFVSGNICKKGGTYTTTPVLSINEDIYNLSLISLRAFGLLTVSDLSKYRDFFTVSDTPYMVFSESRLEDLYRTGKITISEYKSRLESYEMEEKLVKTLRK